MFIDHLAIWTTRLEDLKTFYGTYFGAQTGAKYANPTSGFTSYFLTFDSGCRLEIMSMPGIPDSKDDPLLQATGLIHLAFSVGTEADVDELTARLRVAGTQVVSGPRRTGDGYYESCVLDPNGNRVEITV